MAATRLKYFTTHPLAVPELEPAVDDDVVGVEEVRRVALAIGVDRGRHAGGAAGGGEGAAHREGRRRGRVASAGLEEGRRGGREGAPQDQGGGGGEGLGLVAHRQRRAGAAAQPAGGAVQRRRPAHLAGRRGVAAPRVHRHDALLGALGADGGLRGHRA